MIRPLAAAALLSAAQFLLLLFHASAMRPMCSATAAFVPPSPAATRSSSRHRHRSQSPRVATVAHAAAISPTSMTTDTTTTKRTSPPDVISIFDDFAPRFETKLVETLKYSAPSDVARTASNLIKERRCGEKYRSILDAGCGTGLSGPHLRELLAPSVNNGNNNNNGNNGGGVNGGAGPLLIGVDLSPKMAELAAELVLDDGETPVVENRMRRQTETARLATGETLRLYDGIFTADLLDLSNAQFLEGFGHLVYEMPDQFELIVSADVLCYFGQLGAVLQALAARLEPGGDLIFSVETIAEGDYNWIRLPSDRYAHCPEYVARMGEEAGLELLGQEAFTPRMEAGEKVLGTLHAFHKPS